jgi:hypothetical protein
MENEIILLIIKGSVEALGGYVSVKLFKLILKKFVKADIKFEVIGIKNERANAALNKVIYFVPSICSLFVLAVIVWNNKPFNIIDLIFIVTSVTLIVVNIFMAILIEYLDGIRTEIDDTSKGLKKLTFELTNAKSELRTTASDMNKALESVKGMEGDIKYAKTMAVLSAFRNY